MMERSMMLTAQNGRASREKYHFSNLCTISLTDLCIIGALLEGESTIKLSNVARLFLSLRQTMTLYGALYQKTSCATATYKVNVAHFFRKKMCKVTKNYDTI